MSMKNENVLIAVMVCALCLGGFMFYITCTPNPPIGKSYPQLIEEDARLFRSFNVSVHTKTTIITAKPDEVYFISFEDFVGLIVNNKIDLVYKTGVGFAVHYWVGWNEGRTIKWMTMRGL